MDRSSHALSALPQIKRKASEEVPEIRNFSGSFSLGVKCSSVSFRKPQRQLPYRLCLFRSYRLFRFSKKRKGTKDNDHIIFRRLRKHLFTAAGILSAGSTDGFTFATSSFNLSAGIALGLSGVSTVMICFARGAVSAITFS